MNLRLLTLTLLAGTALSSGAFAQTATAGAGANPPAAPADANRLAPAGPEKPIVVRGSRAQNGLTAAPTDFRMAEITGGNAEVGGYNPLDGVTGQDVGGGFMIQEEAVKTRSTVTRDAIAKMSPTSNPYQMIDRLPGVVITSTDAAGMNGGNITIRGYNSDQLGFTIEGAPINDSGNYALYPQEYVDAENIEQISIAQGSPDLDSPHVGATGGVINMYMRDPSKTMGAFVDTSVGSHNLSREFARLEMGQIGDFRAYASFSNYSRNHWEGPGADERRHVDFRGVWEPSNGNRVTLSIIYNDSINDSYQAPSLPSYSILGPAAVGYNNALPTTFFAPAGPGAWDRTAGNASLFYQYHINPFRNLIVSAPSTFKLSEKVTYDVIPYFWYGFGNGGGTASATESTAGTSFYWGKVPIGNFDWNQNGVVFNKDKNLLYDPSITETLRPGLINKFNFDFDDHKLLLGYWFEYANHRQTAPYAFLNANGGVVDPYVNYGAITTPFGTLERRDMLTETVTNMGFVADTWKYDDHLTIESGVKVVSIHRSVYNFLPGVTPLVTQGDLAALPQAGFRYRFWTDHQFFGSIGTSFKATPNFALADSVSNSSGVVTPYNRLAPEKSVTLELGHRYQGPLFSTALSIYGSHFINYQQSTSEIFPGTTSPQSTTINGGTVDLWGVAFEAGTKPIQHFRPYLSLNYLQTRLLDNLSTTGSVPVGAGTSPSAPDFLPTEGKHLPRAPKFTTGLGVDYDDGHVFGTFAAKYVSGQYSTFMNDQGVYGYLKLDASIGYRFDNLALFGLPTVKKPEFRINLSNLTNRENLSGPSGIQTNARPTVGVYGNVIAASLPTYYVNEGFAAIGTFSVGF